MHMRQLPFPAAVWSLLSATPHSPVGILLQVDHALQLHTTDNVSVITVCFRDTPPPRRMQREVPPVFPAEADACNTTVAACCQKLSLSERCGVAAGSLLPCRGRGRQGLCVVQQSHQRVLRKALSRCPLQGRPAAAMGRTLSREGLSLLNDALLPSSCLPHIPEQRPAQTAAVSGL